MAFLRSCLLSLFLCSSLLGAEVVSPVLLSQRITVPPYTLIRVKLEENESALVIKTNGGVGFIDQVQWSVGGVVQGMVWTAEPGQEYALVTFGPDGQKNMIVEILDYVPDPDNPQPVPPDPTPPKPIVPPNAQGVGQQTYDLAVAVGDPASAAILAKIYQETSNRLLEINSGNEVEDINIAFKWGFDETEKRISATAKPNWTNFRNSVKAMIEEKWKAGANTKAKIVAILREMSQALELVK